MPNEVTSVNDRTLFNAARALIKDGSLTFEQALDAIDRLMDAGFLIREPAEKVTRSTTEKVSLPSDKNREPGVDKPAS